MKKTVQASVGRIPFIFEEDAYEVLKDYLHAIEQHFSQTPGGKEVAEDLEMRAGELLRETVAEGCVVVLNDVQKLMERLGSVKDITGGPTSSAPAPRPVVKRLYRNPDERVLGGVCGGLGAYFGLDPVWLRLLWLVMIFFMGTGLILYLLLWLIIPEARTPAEKLEMKGQPLTLDQLSKSVQEETSRIIHQVNTNRWKVFLRNVGQFGEQMIGYTRRFLQKVFRLLGGVLSLLSILIAALILFFLVQLIAGELAVFKINQSELVLHSPTDTVAWIFPTPWEGWLTLVALVLFLGIPSVMLAVHGIRYLTGRKQGMSWLNIPLFTVWLLMTGLLVWSGIRLARQFYSHQYHEYNTSWPNHWNVLNISMAYPTNEQEGLVLEAVQLHIFRNTQDSLWGLTLQKNSAGPTPTHAAALASAIQYTFHLRGDTLWLPPVICLPVGTKYRGQHVEIFLYVPEGGRLRFDRQAAEHLAHVPNVQGLEDEEMVPYEWVMTGAGLSCVGCKKKAE
ncbi:MAG: PspC domain-containing protein [Flavobacteriales bacterium]|nr:PspC domain-containing protein [Flavobacteriales bacterium]MCX7767609.1 PspC domain-containing protein [Flavobacteriales bacterium]MDW8409549.1 PspC domain-containing protein [Flavobacteriales bacterium]